MNNVLVIGGGGREHAILTCLQKDENVGKIFALNGNGGTEVEGKVQNITGILAHEHARILEFILENEISLTIVGPEAPLSEGVVNFLEANGQKAFGPSREGAMLEASKIFMKQVLVKAGVPTAKYRTFHVGQLAEACNFIEEFKTAIVIKTDGLAAGKGVVICKTKEEAKKEVESFFAGKFGEASKKLVIEEFLDGFEASLFAVTDGITVLPFGSACDHKQIYENDLGENTGGMGTFSPSFLSAEEEASLTQTLITPVVKQLAKMGITYKGVLFAGLMVKEGEAKVLEFNIRWGDPEAQSILPRFEGSLYELCLKTAMGQLSSFGSVNFSTKTAVTVVLASKGYPKTSTKGQEVEIKGTPPHGSFLFHAGTKMEEGVLKTNGGRVLCATAIASTKKEARNAAYKTAQLVHFEGMQLRRDIAEDLVEFDINFEEEGWEMMGVGFYNFFKRLCKLTLKQHFTKEKDLEKVYELSILLTNDEGIAILNKQHRGKEGATNVLSFPLNNEYEKGRVLLGDVVIALETMKREAVEQKKPFEEHLAHLFVHSVLHLLGYDHIEQKEMEEMEEMEDAILNKVF